METSNSKECFEHIVELVKEHPAIADMVDDVYYVRKALEELENLKTLNVKLEKALSQVVYDCDDYVNWHMIAKDHERDDVLNEFYKDYGYTQGVIEYYKALAYVYEGSNK